MPSFETAVEIKNALGNNTGIKFAMKRLEPSVFHRQFETWINGLNVQEIISHQQTDANGYITFSLFYR